MPSRTEISSRDLPEVPYFSLDLHGRADGDIVELLVSGDVDDETVGHLEDTLDRVLDHMPQRLVLVDLHAVTSLRPCGVASLRRVTAALGEAGRNVSVRGGSPVVRSALAEAGVVLVEDAVDPVPPLV